MPAKKDQIDPNVKLPPAVRAKVDKANETHAQAYGAPPADPAPAPADPAPAPADPAPAPADPAPAPAPAPTGWEHRFKSLEGRHRHLEQEARDLRATLAVLQSQPTPASIPKELRPESLLTPQDVETYGEELLDVAGRAALAKVNPKLAELESTLSKVLERVENVGTNVAHDARSRMMAKLDSDLPNWKEINYDDRFLNWLSQRDLYSDALRHDLLKTAYAANDPVRVLAFFKGFLSEEAALAPQPAEQDQPPAPNVPAAQKIPLADLAAPGRARTAATAPVPAEKPIITRADIARFYTDVAAGRYRGRDEERTRVEAQIFAATRERRIQ